MPRESKIAWRGVGIISIRSRFVPIVTGRGEYFKRHQASRRRNRDVAMRSDA
jgi:hypothetical protein